MSSIFSHTNFYQQEEENARSQSPQLQPEIQSSLFSENIIFQDQGNDSNSTDMNNLENIIENDILNMIDEEPIEICPTSTFSPSESPTKEVQIQDKISKSSKKDIVGSILDRSHDFSTQSSNGERSPKTIASDKQCRVLDFNKLFGEGTSSIPIQQIEAEQKKAMKKYKMHYDFPDGGWECCNCSNYNFKGRKNCHRCKKSKSDNDIKGKPGHMFLGIDEKKAIKASKQQDKRKARKVAQLESIANGTYEDDGINSTTPAEFRGKIRQGDWACCRCTNFNYAFRDSCNKCGLMQYEHLYYSTNFQPNSIDWNQVTTSQQMPPPLPYNQTLMMQQQMPQQTTQLMLQNLNVFMPQQVQRQEFAQW